MSYNIQITNGQGTENILNGNYSVTSEINGYDNSSIDPSSVQVVEGTNEYAFEVAATGTLTLHVSENGTSEGTSIVGATFIRTDSSGTEYGDVITSDANGNAVFEYVPYSDTETINVYYKQLSSDGSHEFVSTVQITSLSTQTSTVEITNALPQLRTINLTDANYDGLPLTGTINLS